jgi:hypothetical protein
MGNKKATEDDDVPGDVLKLLGESGLKTMKKLINTIHETGEWPKDFTEVTMIALKKKPQATKCSDHRTINLIANIAMIIAKILRRRIVLGHPVASYVFFLVFLSLLSPLLSFLQ